jgi:hypothetical protein
LIGAVEADTLVLTGRPDDIVCRRRNEHIDQGRSASDVGRPCKDAVNAASPFRTFFRHELLAQGLQSARRNAMSVEEDEDKKNMRLMWIGSGVIVLFIVGMMSLNMLGIIGKTTAQQQIEFSSQSRSEPKN